LDTSHAVVFTRSYNAEDASPDFGGYRVVAAFPGGSADIESSIGRLAGFTQNMRDMNIEIIDTIPALLQKVDVVLLLSNDGRVHLEQAIPVFRSGKTVFIDKPITASLSDAYAIFQASRDFNTPMFTSSSVRYMTNMDDILKNNVIGRVLGAETYGPCVLEATHPDFFWYGIHAVEALCTVMGTGCQTVSRVHTPSTDIAVGIWEGDRVGTFRGLRAGRTNYGGNAFGERGIRSLGTYDGYDPLLKEIATFFSTGIPPVKQEETLEIFTFMDAADESKRRGGAAVSLEETRQKAIAQVRKTW
jgi:predicted dehydrogenase